MKKLSLALLVPVLFFFNSVSEWSCAQAQVQVLPPPPTPIQDYWPPVLFNHYTTAQLEFMRDNDTLKYRTILYYYTQSFILEPIDCNDCIPFIADQFDINKYEQFRQQSTRYVRVYEKYGFKLTLLSIDELVYKLPIHNP